jgi:hypothetical protein
MPDDTAPVVEKPSAPEPAPVRTTVEEYILYGFGVVMLVVFAIMFGRVESREYEIAKRSASPLAAWAPAPTDDRDLAFLKAQLTLSGLRYGQAERATTAIGVRRNFGFLVGTIIALLGCVVAIRGTRGSPIGFAAEHRTFGKYRLDTTSSGAFIVLIGGIIILATVINNDRVQVEDDGIALPGLASAAPPGEPRKVISQAETDALSDALLGHSGTPTTTSTTSTTTTKTDTGG